MQYLREDELTSQMYYHSPSQDESGKGGDASCSWRRDSEDTVSWTMILIQGGPLADQQD